MASLQRTLVNLEMLSDDINALIRCIIRMPTLCFTQCVGELKNAEQFVALETEASFQSRYQLTV